MQFGLVTRVGTQNPIALTLMGWRKIFADMKSTSKLNDRLGYFFGPPDWRPRSERGG